MVSIFIAGCKPNHKSKNDLIDLKIKGAVKSIIESEYNAEEKFGEYQKKELSFKTITFFNENGKLLSKKFDKNGLMAMGVESSWRYDEYSNAIEETMFFEGKLNSKSISDYDKNNNLIEKKHYDNDGKLFARKTYEYNLSNELLETNEFDSKSQFNYKNRFKIDSSGNHTEWRYKSDGELIYKFVKEYNDLGDEICLTSYDKNSYEASDIHHVYAYEYDNNRNMIVSKMYDKNKELKESTTYEYYDFDNFGNWQRRISINLGGETLTIVNGLLKKEDNGDLKKVTILERQIEYFD